MLAGSAHGDVRDAGGGASGLRESGRSGAHRQCLALCGQVTRIRHPWLFAAGLLAT
jgi:hypothetical protein